MATVTTSQDLSAVSFVEAENITIVNGATLTMTASNAVRTGSLICTTKGKFRIENPSPTTPLVLRLHDCDHDLRFEGNAIFETRGAPMELGTGTGAAQTFDFSTLYGGVIPQVTYCEVEETPGSGIYMPREIVHIDPLFNLSTVAEVGRGGVPKSWFGAGGTCQNVLFWHATNRTLESGDGVNGNPIPLGCKIRIPNIYIGNRLRLNESKTHAVLTVGAPTGGTFTIQIYENGTLLGTTAAIAYNASAATIDSALEAVAGMGAGTITTTGGALPTTVTVATAGAKASTRIGLKIGTNSLTGGTNSQALVGHNASSDMSLIDISPSGVMDCEWTCFSDNIIVKVSSFARYRAIACGIGGDGWLVENSNGSVEVDGVSNTCNPYASGASSQIAGIYGPISVRRVVCVKKNAGSNFNLSILPNLAQTDRVYFSMIKLRSATSNNGLQLTTLPKGFIARKIESVGASLQLTNLTDATIENFGYADSVTNAQQTANSVSPIKTGNCVNVVIANYRDAGVSSSRGALVSTDSASSNIQVIGGSSDCADNTPSALFMACAGATVKNFNCTNMRAGPIIDVISSYLAKDLVIKKLFTTYATAQTSTGCEVCQGGQFDLLSSTVAGITETFTGINDYVGGNFAENSLTPTTGHVSFGPFAAGEGLEMTGEAYTDQAGRLVLPKSGDVATATIPFSMHAILAFLNDVPYIYADGLGVWSNVHLVRNETATGGTFTVSIYSASNTLIGTTAAIAYNASTATVQAALEAVAGIGVGQVASVSGTLGGGYTITFGGTLAAVATRITADGALLTGGTTPGVAYAYGRARAFVNWQSLGAGFTAEFSVRVPGESWSAWQTITGANVAASIPALTGYAPGGAGLDARIRLTAVGDDPYRAINQLSLLTTIDPSLWLVGDATLTLAGPAPTDVTTLYRASDNSVLATFTGAGEKEFTVGSNFLADAYFVRRNASAVEIMRTQTAPIALKYGDNGTIDLFAGAEVGLAQSSVVDAIYSHLLAHLDVDVSTRLAAASYVAPDNASVTAIKAKTDNLPADPADQSAVEAAISAIPAAPSAATNASAVRTELATELARIDANITSRSTLTAGDIPAGLSAAQVWSYVTRELTSAAGLTPAQAATLDQIASDVAPLPGDPASQSVILAAIADISGGGDGGPTAADIWAYPTRTITSGGITLAEIEASTVLAKEATVASKASQASVNALGSPLQAGSYTAPDNASVAAIKAKTDNLPSDPADQSLIEAKIDTIRTYTPTMELVADLAIDELTADLDILELTASLDSET